MAVHERWEGPAGKSFLWKHPNGKYSRRGEISPASLPLYGAERLDGWPEVDRGVVLVEGEKAADALLELGIRALGTVTGSSSAPGPEALEVLAGRRVILWPDDDRSGREHMRRVAERLQGIASSVRWFEWKGPAGITGPDAADHPAVQSGDRVALRELGEELAKAPAWEPPEAKPDPEDLLAAGEGPPSTNGRGSGEARGAPGFNLTDLGNSERFVADHGEGVRYCYPWGKWLVWTGARWERDDSGKVHRLAKETVRSIYREAADAEDEGRRKELAKHATRSEAEARIRATLELAKSELPISPDELDADPWLLNCKNGTIDLRTGELRAHRRGDLVTRLVPTEFDPAARLATWDRFLSDATNGKDGLEAFLRRGVGYSLTGDMGEKVLFFIHGPKDAGKTTFLEAIKAALGDYSDTIGFDALLERGQRGGPRPEIAQLPGKRFVASSEVKEGSKMAVEVVKALTGWDQLQVRNVYERPFSFVPQCKLWLAANHAPRVPVDDDATWDRILRIPFENTVPKSRRDPDVQRILRDPEQSGAAILAWAVRGCAEWRREGLGVPQVVKAATDEYREDMDPLGDFMADYCVLGPDLWVHSGQLREAYEKWARETGEQSLVRGKKWGAGLRAHGCTPDTTPDKKSRIWRGIALKHGPGDGHEWRPAERVTPARTDSVQEAKTAANGEEAHDLSDGSGGESVKFSEDSSYEGEFRDNASESVRRGESVQGQRDQRVEEDAGEGLRELLDDPPRWLRDQLDRCRTNPALIKPTSSTISYQFYGTGERWREVRPYVEAFLRCGADDRDEGV